MRRPTTQGQEVGILAIGTFLPDEIRTNEWWPKPIVQIWRQRLSKLLPALEDLGRHRPLSEGTRAVIEAMAKLHDDPFRGAVERRVMPEGMQTSTMEVKACEEALRRAGVRPAQVDYLAGFTNCPDQLGVPQVCRLHQQLNLNDSCLSVIIDAQCASFLKQLVLGCAWIGAGHGRYGLLVQSTGLSRLMRQDDPYSAWLGDAATAVVIGKVPPGYGLLAASHCTDGSLFEALSVGAPDRPWYAANSLRFFAQDPAQTYRMLMGAADVAKQTLGEAFERAQVRDTDIDFYAAHQATAWFRRVTQDVCGMSNARSVDIFASMGSLAASNLPMVMYQGEKDGSLKVGDLVALHAAGNGISGSAAVVRWSGPQQGQTEP